MKIKEDKIRMSEEFAKSMKLRKNDRRKEKEEKLFCI
jgi:hypothetical protein